MKTPLPHKLYYSIREVADHFEVATSLLRFWESEFEQLSPKRNEKGTRFYTKKNVEDISEVYHLVKEKGFTLQGAKDALKNNTTTAKKTVHLKKSLISIREALLELRTSIADE
jgi:DNA-binding transcriptional MerR regulator